MWHCDVVPKTGVGLLIRKMFHEISLHEVVNQAQIQGELNTYKGSS